VSDTQQKVGLCDGGGVVDPDQRDRLIRVMDGDERVGSGIGDVDLVFEVSGSYPERANVEAVLAAAARVGVEAVDPIVAEAARPCGTCRISPNLCVSLPNCRRGAPKNLWVPSGPAVGGGSASLRVSPASFTSVPGARTGSGSAGGYGADQQEIGTV
jgi:hypothetical protein